MVEEEMFGLLSEAAASSGKQPCGCNETQGEGEMEFDLFGAGEGASATSDLSGELDSALAALASGPEAEFASLEGLSLEEELEFAEIGGGSQMTLDDLISFAERNPGLKITISF